MASPLEEDILEKDFRILTPIGSGAFGEVRLACHLPTNTQVAVKVLKKNNNILAETIPEVKILQFLEHKNIVRFFHVIDTLKRIYVVMEYVAGNDLQTLLDDIGYLREEKARPIFQQVVSAVHFLHQRCIAHRDIKLENILIDRAGNIKLCDFGMAIQLTEGQILKNSYGSLLYMAPEILAGKPYDALAVDMWSLGILLYVMVTGQFPYEATTYHDLYELITNTKFTIPYHLSKPCGTLIAQLLMVPICHRITIYQLLKRRWLGHIEEPVGSEKNQILPRLIEVMCTIGYTYEEIMSSLTQRQLNNKIKATINILRYKLSCEDSHVNQKPCSGSSPTSTLEEESM